MTKDSLIRDMPRGWARDDKAAVEDKRQLFHPATTGMWADGQKFLFSKKKAVGGIPLGSTENGDIHTYVEDRHFITFAGSRAGKGVSLIIPTLCLYEGGVLAIDPKGELASITAARRGNGSEYCEGMKCPTYVLDPFKRTEGNAVQYRASFNPLNDIDPETDEGLTYATMIADGLVVQEQGAGAHFTASARSFLRGLILYVCATETGTARSLIRVRELISQSESDFEAMLTHMVELGGVIGRAATSLKLKAENERASVISTADVQTDFLEDGAMRDVLCEHDFDLKDLRGENPATVFLCLPAGRLATHGRWLRLMIAIAMEKMEEVGALKDWELPALFVLDEFAALGHMASLEKAAGQIAGFGVKLWAVLQDVTQLKRDYKDSWETFIGNAGMVTAFGVSDASTTEYLSKLLGKTVIQATSTNSGYNSGQGGGGSSIGTSMSYQTVNLLDPHEVALYFNRDVGRLLCKPAGSPPFITKRIYYYDDLVGFHDPAPGRKPPPTLEELSQVKKEAAKEPPPPPEPKKDTTDTLGYLAGKLFKDRGS